MERPISTSTLNQRATEPRYSEVTQTTKNDSPIERVITSNYYPTSLHYEAVPYKKIETEPLKQPRANEALFNQKQISPFKKQQRHDDTYQGDENSINERLSPAKPDESYAESINIQVDNHEPVYQ